MKAKRTKSSTSNLPNGWRMAKLAEIAGIQTGSANSQDASEDGIYPLFDRSSKVKKIDTYIFDCRAVIVPGEGKEFIPRFYSGKFHLHQRAYCISSKEEGITDIRYLYYALLEKREYWKMVAVGSTVKSLRLNSFTDFPLLLPSIGEQKAIAHILGALDDKIEANRKMSETLEEIAKAIFKSWFVEFDPVRAKMALKKKAVGNWTTERARAYLATLPAEVSELFPDKLVNSERGEIPKGWKPGATSSVCRKIDDAFGHGENWSGEKLIDLGRMPRNSISLYDFGVGSELSTSIRKFKKYDFLFGSIRPYFNKAGIAPFDGVTNTSVFVLRANSINLRGFLYCHGSVGSTFEKSVQLSGGTKMPVIKWEDFAGIQVALPSQEILAKFSEITEGQFEKIIQNVNECRTLSALRDSLLPKLVSGELQIPDAEKFLKEAGI